MAKSIMIQGTMSSAGKSLVAAGLCRVFRQDGYTVAPFKSQNMALNSYVTAEGLEMGRAQVMQAEAAGAEPSVLMNPILLKPTSDVGSQIIVNGEVRAVMDARGYFAYKKTLVPDILAAYQKLSAAYDIVVIEGAGSPAEINLKEHDIVNMGMARLADAPVLLVGDIDRGGVFAQLVGTLALLEDDERRRIKGLVINKFRGDKSLLTPGIRMLEERCGVPVVGTLPYLHIDLDDEDSLTERFASGGGDAAGMIDIAVLQLPHISNFTDFVPLSAEAGVHLRYVKRVGELGHPDAVIVPGTKNTMDDLRWLRQNGMEAAVKKLAAAEVPVLGICGGFQMLGREIDDSAGAEAGGCMQGMGLLPVKTVFSVQKTRTRVTGSLCPAGMLQPLSGSPVEGYEIHMGRTTFCDGEGMPFVQLRDESTGTEKADGACCGSVFGTYLHGLFDSSAMTRRFVSLLAEKKGLPLQADTPVLPYAVYKERQYDLLADAIRAHMDVAALYRFMEEAHAGV